MFRFAASVLVLLSFLAPAAAQTPPASTTPSAPAKSPAKKQAPKASTGARAPVPAETGPCQVGVISAVGDQFTVLHVGLTMLGNEFMEAPIDAWGIDDLLVARVQAAGGTGVRKIAYAKGAFRPYYHPEAKLFRNDRDDLTTLVRQIAGNANCGRYIVATKENVTVDGNQTIAGVGVYKNWASPAGRGVVVAHIRITVFDGRTFDIQRAPTTRSFGEALASGLAGKNDNIRILNDLDFPKTAEQAAGSAVLRDNTRGLMAAKLDKILPPYFAQ